MTHQILLQRIILDKHATELLRIEKKSHKHTRDAPFYGLEATATASSRQNSKLAKDNDSDQYFSQNRAKLRKSCTWA